MILRLKYSKTPAGRFLSHLDLLRSMERAFRRAGLPLAFSEGFNPHPKISYGSALAVGVSSEGEYLDLELRQDFTVEEIWNRLEGTMPPGLKVLEIKELENRGQSLTALINLARYRVKVEVAVPISQEMVNNWIALALSQTSYSVTREGKKGPRPVEIRPGIFSLSGQAKDRELELEMDLLTGSSGNVKPEEVVKMLANLGHFSPVGAVRVHRLGLFVFTEDKIRSPLEV